MEYIAEVPGMMVSDNFAMGLGYLLILAGGLILFGIVLELPVMYWILKRITDRNMRLAILAIALLPGYAVFMNLGGSAPALALIGPVAALIPFVVSSAENNAVLVFKRVVLVYCVIVLFEILLLTASLYTGMFWGTLASGFNPVITFAQYAGFVILDILVALALYRLMPESQAGTAAG